MAGRASMHAMATMAGGMAIGMLFVTLAACSSNQTKPMTQPTPDQVRGHADHGFDKLKQEERDRGAQPPAP